MKINKSIAEKVGVVLLMLGVASGSAALLVPKTGVTGEGSLSNEIELPTDPDRQILEKLSRDLPSFSVFFLTSSGVLLALAAVPDRRQDNFKSISRNKGIAISASTKTSSGKVEITFAADECTDIAIANIVEKIGTFEEPSSKLDLQSEDDSQDITPLSEESLENSPEPKALGASTEQPIETPQPKFETIETEK